MSFYFDEDTEMDLGEFLIEHLVRVPVTFLLQVVLVIVLSLLAIKILHAINHKVFKKMEWTEGLDLGTLPNG